MYPSRLATLLAWAIFAIPSLLLAQSDKKSFTFEDIMRFQSHSNMEFSTKGNYLGFDFWPDRGDGEARIYQTDGLNKELLRVPLGKGLQFDDSERFAALRITTPLATTLKDTKKKFFDSLAVYSLSDASRLWATDSLKSFAFSADGVFLAVHKQAEKHKGIEKTYGSDLHLVKLPSLEVQHFAWVSDMSMDSTASHLMLAIADTSGMENTLLHIQLKNNLAVDTLHKGENLHYDNLRWHHDQQKLAFAVAEEHEKGKMKESDYFIYLAGKDELQPLKEISNVGDMADYTKAQDAQFYWSKDGKRLFFGLQPTWVFNALNQAEAEKDTLVDVYSMQQILDERTVDVWHTEDPMIKTHEKKQWRNTQRQRLSLVYHTDKDALVVLGEPKQQLDVQASNHSYYVLASDNTPYMKEMTWDGWYQDRYIVDLNNGVAQQIAQRHSGDMELSPDGKRVVFYQDSTWHAIKKNEKSMQTIHFEQSKDARFYNEDHDYPSQVPSYGFAAWVGKEANKAIVYDKYDLLLLHLDSGKIENITNGYGRENHLTFRILTDQREPLHLKEIKNLTLAGYHNLQKSDGIYRLKKAGQNPEKILHGDKKWDFAAKAKSSKHWLFTREDYHEYPDFYLFEEGKWNKPTRLTDLHPDVAEYNWGRSELVEWKSLDGTDMQGVVIKPENFEEGKKYPVLVYYYRFFSQRLHEFNMPRINHRPAFPLWASDGYLIFLPDIRFEVGRPGLASTKSLVPGVQKLIDLGWADPEAIGLHGHSWSGYQTAMMITHTDIFKAAIAGAPVSNMTSAYGGIRWGSGMARAFQYEKTQSRLGVSMWENLQPYIENSPLFFADKINTPLLFIHGDVDGAVPWYQSIELYVALRRLGKEAVFLQYHGEDHHPATYPNKMDWALKMKQYFDHYLKGEPAEAWIKDGVRYEGK